MESYSRAANGGIEGWVSYVAGWVPCADYEDICCGPFATPFLDRGATELDANLLVKLDASSDASSN